jgi:hypothetical protein
MSTAVAGGPYRTAVVDAVQVSPGRWGTFVHFDRPCADNPSEGGLRQLAVLFAPYWPLCVRVVVVCPYSRDPVALAPRALAEAASSGRPAVAPDACYIYRIT